MGSAMLFSGTRKIGTPSQRSSTGPDNGLTSFHAGRKQLVFQIAMQHACLLCQLYHSLGFAHITGQRLLASDAHKLSFAGPHSVNDALHIIQPHVVRAANPDAIDLGSSHHFLNRIEGASVTHSQSSRH